MSVTATGILFSLLIFQLFFLSFFLFTQEKGRKISHVLLGLFFLFIALNLLDVFLLMTGVYFPHPALAGWGSCLPLLFGPLLFFYTQSVLYKGFAMDWRKGVHLLAFGIVFCCAEGVYLSLSRQEQENFLHGVAGQHFPRVLSVVSLLIFLQFLVYVFASLRLLLRYKNVASQHFSDQRRTDLSWLYSTLLFFAGVIIFAALRDFLVRSPGVYLVLFNVLVLSMLIFVNRVLLRALRRQDFFAFEEESPAPAPAGNDGSEERIRAHPQQEGIAERILLYMEDQKPYIDSELTLDQLAGQLSLKAKLLSHVINEVLGQNFFDFVNRYRIQEARRLLTNPEDKKLTVLEVLYQVGFNSKSSFNTLFKKYTGLTPTEFRKNSERSA
jgi:AraC-like DNA-binding protein